MADHPRARPWYRPRARASRASCVLVIGLAMVAPVSLPSGSADELDARKQKVERRIERAEKDLHHSSTRLTKAVRRLDRAVTALERARADLAGARDDLAAAEAHDRRMQAALDEAVAEEARARDALADGQEAVADREEELRAVAVEMHAAGGTDLMALSAVLRSREPAQVTGRLSMRRTVLEREAAAVSGLEAAAVMLTVREAAMVAAAQEAARRREAAAESLERRMAMEARARAVRSRVHELVVRRREARREAAAAKAEDLARVRQFRKERRRIAEQLRRRAAKIRRLAGHGAARSPGALARPVNGYLTSHYGMRLHPVYKRWALHDGADFGAGCGTPVRASRGGVVVGTYYDHAYGNRVILDHGWVRGAGLATSYNHLRGSSVHVGERVRRGEVIGRVGNTGYSTGCHLHFMVFRNGATVNPMGWL